MGIIGLIGKIIKTGAQNGVEDALEDHLIKDVYSSGKKTLKYFKKELRPKYEVLDNLDKEIYDSTKELEKLVNRRTQLEKEIRKG